MGGNVCAYSEGTSFAKKNQCYVKRTSREFNWLQAETSTANFKDKWPLHIHRSPSSTFQASIWERRNQGIYHAVTISAPGGTTRTGPRYQSFHYHPPPIWATLIPLAKCGHTEDDLTCSLSGTTVTLGSNT